MRVWEILATAAVLTHLAAIAFMVAGGLLALRWPRAALIHLPFAAWGVLVQLMGWVCPLTPLESWLWRRGGREGYEGAFLDRYVFRFLYPESPPAHLPTVLGLLVLLANLLAYGWALARWLPRLRRSPR